MFVNKKELRDQHNSFSVIEIYQRWQVTNDIILITTQETLPEAIQAVFFFCIIIDFRITWWGLTSEYESLERSDNVTSRINALSNGME